MAWHPALAVAKLTDLAAADAGPIFADRTILAAFSSCVRGLPADSEEWDVSNLVAEGQAVEQHTLVAWLNAIYMLTLDAPSKQQPEVVSGTSMRNLALLLAFADAVGSSRFLLSSLLGDLVELVAEVKLPTGELQDQQKIQQPLLQLQAAAYHIWLSEVTLQTSTRGPSGTSIKSVELGTTARKVALIQQVSQQTEVLLYYAHSLKLPAVQHKVHHFIQINTNLIISLLYGLLYRRRVLGPCDWCGGRQVLLQADSGQQHSYAAGGTAAASPCTRPAAACWCHHTRGEV